MKGGNPRNKKNGCKGGRNPFPYTNKLGEKICEAVKNTVRSLNWICENNPDFPSVQTIRMWLSKNVYPEFSSMYAEAKQFQADCFAEEIVTVAYEAEPHQKNGFVEKAKLQVDALKWCAARLNRRKYSEKHMVQEIEMNLRERFTDEQIKEKLGSILKDVEHRIKENKNKNQNK